MDFLTFCKLPINEQHELVEKVFGSPELVVRDELVEANKLASKRKKTKESK